MRDIAEVIGRRLGIPVVSKTREEAMRHFGWLGVFVGSDLPASSAQTQKQLGWRPTERGLIADLDEAHNLETGAASPIGSRLQTAAKATD